LSGWTRCREVAARSGEASSDRGYFKGEEVLHRDEAVVVPLVPKPQTSNNKAAGLFDRSDFVYSEAEDT
jgi:hypothetical protein